VVDLGIAGKVGQRELSKMKLTSVIAVVSCALISPILFAANADITNNPSPTSQDLYRAVNDENLDLVKHLIDTGADPRAETISSDGSHTPILFVAVNDNNIKLVTLLLEKGADPNAVKVDRSGSRAPMLYTAVNSKDVAMATLLLEKGADPNAVEVGRSDSRTPILSTAVNRKDIELVTLLLEKGADPNARSIWNGRVKSVLEQAINERQDDMVALLTKYGVAVDGGARSAARRLGKDGLLGN
jgi:ankyrin repeat protein